MAVVANVAINVDAANAIQQLNRVKSASQDVQGGFERAASRARGLGSALVSALGPLLSMAAVLKTVKDGLDIAFERGQAEQRLRNLTGSTEEFNVAMALASQSSQKFGLTQTEATKALADVYGRLKGVGFGLQETGQIYQGFNAIALQSGLAGEEAAGAFFQLSQALGKGKLNGDEFVIVAERMPQLLDAIATTTGKSRGELQGMAAAGQITSQVLYEALAGAASASDNLNGKLTTQQQAFNSLRQASDELLASIGQAFAPAVIAGAQLLSDALVAIREKMPLIVAAAQSLLAPFMAIGSVVLPAVKAGFEGVLNNIQPIIQTATFFGTFIGILKGITIATTAWTAATTALANAKKAAAVAAAALQAIVNPANLAKVGVAIAGAAAASYALGKAMDQAAVGTTKTKDESSKLQGSVDQVLKKYSSLPPAAEDLKAKQKEVNAEFEKSKGILTAKGELRSLQLDTEIKLKEAAKDQVGAYELRKQKIKEEYDTRSAALRLELEHGKISQELYTIKSQILAEEMKNALVTEDTKRTEEARQQLSVRIKSAKEQEAAAARAVAEAEAAAKKETEERLQWASKTMAIRQQIAEMELSSAQTEEQKSVATNLITVAKKEQANLEFEIARRAEGATSSYIRAADALRIAKIESFELAANLARSAAEAERIRNLGNAYRGTEFGGALNVSNVALQEKGLAIWRNALEKTAFGVPNPLDVAAILSAAQMQIANLQSAYLQAQQKQKYQSALNELQTLGLAPAPMVTPATQTGFANYGSASSMRTPQVNISTGPVMQMDGQNYVTMGDLQAATTTAAQQGADLALSRLQTNPAIRRSIGVAR